MAVVDAEHSTDGNEVLAVIEDDPYTSGTQYTYVRVPDGNGQFVTNEVQPGDIVRAQYTGDGFGGTTYTEYVVDAVINQDTLRLVSGPSAPITVPAKIEVWRNLSHTEQSQELAKTQGFSNRRVVWVWPDEVGSGGLTIPGYHLCAALAGLASGVVSHQGLTRLEISGFDDVTHTLQFSRSQLNTMAAGGVWIVTQDLETGDIFTRHAVTTADYDDINEREETVTRNVDVISYFHDLYEPYIGISNVTDGMIETLDTITRAGIQYLKSLAYVDRLGSTLIDATIRELRKHFILRDRTVIVLDLQVPYAMNNIECHLVVA